MYTLVTNGIEIIASPMYQADLSNPMHRKFVFTYKISIVNKSKYEVQLLSRKWYIFDSSGTHREVEGEGVVGQQPVLRPGEEFIYESWCPLISRIGYMKGHYTMKRSADHLEFQVFIPQFDLMADYIFN